MFAVLIMLVMPVGIRSTHDQAQVRLMETSHIRNLTLMFVCLSHQGTNKMITKPQKLEGRLGQKNYFRSKFLHLNNTIAFAFDHSPTIKFEPWSVVWSPVREEKPGDHQSQLHLSIATDFVSKTLWQSIQQFCPPWPWANAASMA